jgi:hypothetical protein
MFYLHTIFEVHSNVTTLVYEEIREGLDEKFICLPSPAPFPSPPLPSPLFLFCPETVPEKNIGG